MTLPHLSPSRRQGGFTLVELLVVIVIIGILMALLIPSIYAVLNRAKEARVSAEITNLDSALTGLKSGEFGGQVPPSRIVLREDGIYTTSNPLHARSLRYLRRRFPRVAFPPPAGYYDFNNNGAPDAVDIVLEGDEALVFWLGGIPIPGPTLGTFTGMAGWGKLPTDPFNNANNTSTRNPPTFPFLADRLIDLDGDGMPSYIDPISDDPSERRPFVYFSSYGQGGYDPDDVNSPLETLGQTFTVSGMTGMSVGPNPYTSSIPNPPTTGSRPVMFLNDKGFQIISAGRDRIFGAGGQYDASTQGDRLPGSNSSPASGTVPLSDRAVERDNLTNFSSGRLD